jgi:hypothetical protein
MTVPRERQLMFAHTPRFATYTTNHVRASQGAQHHQRNQSIVIALRRHNHCFGAEFSQRVSVGCHIDQASNCNRQCDDEQRYHILPRRSSEHSSFVRNPMTYSPQHPSSLANAGHNSEYAQSQIQRDAQNGNPLRRTGFEMLVKQMLQCVPARLQI